MRRIGWVVAAFALSSGCLGAGTGSDLRGDPELQVLLFRLEGSLEASVIRGEGPPPAIGANCIVTVRELDNGTFANYDYQADRAGVASGGALLFGRFATNTPLYSGCGDGEWRYLADGENHLVSLSDTFSGSGVRVTRGSGGSSDEVSLADDWAAPGDYAHHETDWTWEYEHEGKSWTLMYWLNLTLRNEGPIPASRVWHAPLSELWAGPPARS